VLPKLIYGDDALVAEIPSHDRLIAKTAQDVLAGLAQDLDSDEASHCGIKSTVNPAETAAANLVPDLKPSYAARQCL
jgi:hypothetical protein